MTTRYHNEYKRNEVSTSSQGKLILMMYEGAAKFTKMALQCIDKGDIPGKGLYIRKAHDILNELSISLDLKKGGEIATKLEGLYQFMLTQLMRANIRSDREALESVLKTLAPLYEAWTQLYNTNQIQDNPKPQAAKSIASKG